VTLSASTVVTDAAGEASVVAAAGTAPGVYFALATVGADTVSFRLEVLAGEPVALNILGVSTPTTVVGTDFPGVLAVQAIDAWANPVAGVDIEFFWPDPLAGASAVVAPVATTDEEGVARVAATANTVAGSYDIVASYAGSAATTFLMTNRGGAPASLLASGGSGQRTPVGGSFAASLDLVATDAFGNPAAGYDLTWTSPVSGAAAVVSGDASTDADGAASAAVTANFASGEYLVRASASPEVFVDFTLTNTPGAASVGAVTPDTGTSGADLLTNDALPTLTGTAEAGRQVELFVDGGSAGTTTSDVDGVWTVALSGTPLADGPHEVKARVVTAADNVGPFGESLSFVIDATAPGAVSVSTFSPDTGLDGDAVTASRTLSLVGLTETGTTVVILDDGQELGQAFVNGTSFMFEATGLVDGTHSFVALATDAAGNVSAAGTPLVVVVDGTTPSIPTFTGLTDDTGVPGDSITRDTTPTVSGTASAGQSVELFVDGVSAGIVTSDGQWAQALVLEDGVYALSARATNVSGGQSDLSSPYRLVIDATAPEAPGSLSFAPDTAVPGDALTKATSLTFSGTAEAGATVVLFDGALPMSTTTADAEGAWHLEVPGLSGGSHAFTATATDAAGNAGAASSPLTVVVDAVAPAPPVVASLTREGGASVADAVTNANVLRLAGSAEVGATVTVLIDGSTASEVSADGGGAWSYDTALLSDGVHRFTATATDAAGNVSSVSAPIETTVDTAIPAAPSLVSFSEDTGRDAADHLTKDDTLVLSGTAEDGVQVSVYVGGELVGTVTATGGVFEVTTATLNEGLKVFSARASDAAGNLSGTSAALSVTVDLSAPSVPAISAFSVDSGVAGDARTNGSDLLLSGSAEEGATVVLFDGEVVLGSAVATADGWQLQTGLLTDGVHAFTVVATDTAGNDSVSSASFTVEVDTAAPAAPSIFGFADDSGTVGDGLTSDTSPSFEGSAEPGATVELFEGTTLLGTALADAAGGWHVDVASTIEEGPHTLTARATDAVGNTGPDAAAFFVVIDTAAPAAPVLVTFSDDSGVTGDGRTNDPSLVFSGTAEQGTRVELFDGAASVGIVLADVDGRWSLTAPSLADGLHTFTASATDAAANVSIHGTGLAVTVDTQAPAAPVFTGFIEDTGVEGDGLTKDASPTFTGYAEAGSRVAVHDGQLLLGIADADGQGAWVFTPDALSPGEHRLTAQATDAAANAGDASDVLLVVVDPLAPAAPVILAFDGDTGLEGDGRTSDTTPTLFGTAEPGCTVAVVLNDAVVGTVAVDELGAWQFTSAALSDGAYAFTARATDAAGNEGPVGTERTV
ncbi:MAG: hypothetical protein RL199_1974, partial [Pseudomonadota bacterium]